MSIEQDIAHVRATFHELGKFIEFADAKEGPQAFERLVVKLEKLRAEVDDLLDAADEERTARDARDDV